MKRKTYWNSFWEERKGNRSGGDNLNRIYRDLRLHPVILI